MSIPKFLQPYLASYNLRQLNIKKDKRTIITQILNKGNSKAVKWLFENYSLSEIKEVVKNPARGMWFEQSLSYWQRIFNLKIPKDNFKLAIFHLETKPDLYQKFYPTLP